MMHHMVGIDHESIGHFACLLCFELLKEESTQNPIGWARELYVLGVGGGSMLFHSMRYISTEYLCIAVLESFELDLYKYSVGGYYRHGHPRSGLGPKILTSTIEDCYEIESCHTHDTPSTPKISRQVFTQELPAAKGSVASQKVSNCKWPDACELE
eukprot:5729587-Amphidinium_carterae.1